MARHRRLVADIAAENQVPPAGLADDVGGLTRHGGAIQRGVEADRGGGQGVDLRRFGAGRPRHQRRNRRQPAAGREIQHSLAGDGGGIVQHMAGDGDAAGPGEGPEGRRDIGPRQPILGRLPDRGDLGGEI